MIAYFAVDVNLFSKLLSRFSVVHLTSYILLSLIRATVEFFDRRLPISDEQNRPAPKAKDVRFNSSTFQRFNRSMLRRLLARIFRFCSQRESTGQGIEDFRVPERPGIINRDSVEAPLVAITHQVAMVAVH